MLNKKNNVDKEKVMVYIMIFSVIVIAVIIGYTIFNSNSNLYNNTSDNYSNNAPNTNNTNTNNNGNITEQEKDNMNVGDPSTQTPTTPVAQETEVATYTTTIYDKDPDRVHNISLAISKLNNTIIKSNEEFSFNNLIGAMDASNGYKKALGFDSNGKKIQMYGGGICQISSTLYNTALITNLQITERHPHSRRVYYVPVDKDATVFYGHRDLKFINNSDSDLKIVASNDNNNVTVKLLKISNNTNNSI